MTAFQRILGVGFAAVLIVGCSSTSDDEDSAPEQSATKVENVAFLGKPERALAATWATDDGRSTLVLKPDGTGSVRSKVPTPGGVKQSDVPTRWKVNDNALLLQGSDGGTIRYYMDRKDSDTIEMRRVKGSRIKFVYKRKT